MSASPPGSRATSPTLSWGLMMLAGIVLVILGVVALGSTVTASLVAAVFIGWLVLIGGVTHLIGSFSAGSWSRGLLSAVIGLIYLAAGWQLIVSPLFGAIALTLIIAIALIITGLVRIFGAFAEHHEHRVWVVAGGALSIFFGLLLFIGWPFTGVFALGIFLGAELVVNGLSLMTVAWDIRSGDSELAGSAG